MAADAMSMFGPVERCKQVVRAYIDAGVRHFVINPTCPPGDVERQLTILAEQVLPGRA